MSHRVIAGKAKGLRLKMVPGNSTRPIMDRAKESLFNIIGYDIYDAYWLDLFAGTGAVGIEALSRGAEHVLFCDLEPAAVQIIQENLKSTRLYSQSNVMRVDAFKLLKGKPPKRFDYIYIAPPQYQNMWQQALKALEKNPQWLPEGTKVIVQIDPKEKTDVSLSRLELTDERRYGNTLLCFYEAITPENETMNHTLDMTTLEQLVDDLMDAFEITTINRVPLEYILQNPKENMWDEIDAKNFTIGLINPNPQNVLASVARGATRELANSPWGEANGLAVMKDDEELIAIFARMLLMPRKLIIQIPEDSRTIKHISDFFEASPDDVEKRLQEMQIK